MKNKAADYPWFDELEKTIVQSLTTTFGLDFLLFKDQVGGDVNTIHNVRQGVYATEQEKKHYEERGEYSSKAYHSHYNYKNRGSKDKELQKQGNLYDSYKNQNMGVGDYRDLDHVISAKEIYDDQGRVLAELLGEELANQDSNLHSTSRTVNRSKKQTSIKKYLEKLPVLIKGHQKELDRKIKLLEKMPRHTAEQKHKANELYIKIKKEKNKIKELESIDPNKMISIDERARSDYNSSINSEYYTSSKFLISSTSASAVSGLKMGTRQMLGLILAEVWFELRSQIPIVFNKLRSNFKIEDFLNHIVSILKGIWERIKIRFQTFLMEFKDGAFSGIMASLTTTVLNILATTQLMVVKILREIWAPIARVVKLIIFNPDQLSFVDLCKTSASIISAAVAAAIGVQVYTYLIPLLSFPFGGELAAFCGALVTGLVTLGVNYSLFYSKIADKLWGFVESIMPHVDTVKRFQAINVELDKYLTELARLEFNLDPEELEIFSMNLRVCNTEIERGLILKSEIKKRNIDLPYEIGDEGSTRRWLASLIK